MDKDFKLHISTMTIAIDFKRSKLREISIILKIMIKANYELGPMDNMCRFKVVINRIRIAVILI